MKIDRLLLFPYAIVLAVRNLFYDKGVLKSYPSVLPSICVGNITVGGTGKTPAVEMLIRLYRDSRRIAVVSRGYGRRTKGFRTVSVEDNYRDVGDEPLQIKRKFPDVAVVVDASRRRAVDALAAMSPDVRPDLVILDDAFQHRRLRPDFSIVLVSSTRPVFKDSLLPIGRLRGRNPVLRAFTVEGESGTEEGYPAVVLRHKISPPSAGNPWKRRQPLHLCQECGSAGGHSR